MHYSQNNADPEKRGKPIIELEQYVPRPERDIPPCKECPTLFRWMPANKAVYVRWSFERQGIDTGPKDAELLWNFFRLNEAARELEQEKSVLAVARGINLAFSEDDSGN